MNVHEVSTETSYILDKVSPSASLQSLEILKSKYRLSPRSRHRFCYHQSPSVDLHDIIICYDATTYIPPNKHVGKVESLLILQGTIDFFLFSDLGFVYDYRRLSSSDSAEPFYIRVPANTWHGLRVVGDKPCIVKETISGPYDRSSLQWASFAPSESDGANVGLEWYDSIMAECVRKDIISPQPEVFEQVSESVFRSSRQLVTVSAFQLDPVVEAAFTTNLKRARLCCHLGSEEKLQEMFIALANDVSIDESIHIRKDESLTVISGSGRYIFPNEDGSERDVILLSSIGDQSNSDSAFFARINRYVPHKILVDSPYMIIHESTTGPFNRSDTDYRIRRFDQ